jgi:hypothetical protein
MDRNKDAGLQIRFLFVRLPKFKIDSGITTSLQTKVVLASLVCKKHSRDQYCLSEAYDDSRILEHNSEFFVVPPRVLVGTSDHHDHDTPKEKN